MSEIRKITPEVVDRATRGEVYIRQGGRDIPMRLTAEQAEAYERAQERGYLVCRSDTSNLANAWRAWCDATRTHDVLVTLKRKYARLRIDAAQTGLSFNETGGDKLEAAFRRYCPEDRTAILHGVYTTAERVPVENAEALAAEVVRIASDPANLVPMYEKK